MNRVAIVGAGPSGIVSAKCAIECGLIPTVFEKSNMIGGIWKPQNGSVWESMRTNISHHTCSFSDFGWPDSIPDFPNQREIYDYLQRYAKHFHLLPFIQFNSAVQKISRVGNQWLMTWHQGEKTFSRPFEHVIVGSGIFSKPFIPPNLQSLAERILHSSHYKTPEPFKDKNVVIVGNAFSGCEIASEIASVAKKVVHLFRRNIWVIPRYLPHQNRDVPLDLIFYSRAAQARSEGVHEEELNRRRNGWFKDLTKQGEKCEALTVEAALEAPCFVAISDTYVENVQSGKIEIKKGFLDHLEERKLVLKDGSFVSADVIVLCTGFQMDLPFFDEKVLEKLEFCSEDQLQPILLHNTVFPQDLPNLAFVGAYRGPYFGGIELQARWAAMVFSKRIPAPSKEEIREGVEQERAIRNKNPRSQFPHGDYVRFSDRLAKQIGVLPNFEQMQKEDPVLYQKIWEGPFTPASFRLKGFGAKPEIALSLIEKIHRTFLGTSQPLQELHASENFQRVTEEKGGNSQ